MIPPSRNPDYVSAPKFAKNHSWEQEEIEINDSQISYLLKHLAQAVFFDSEANNPSAQYNIISGEPAETATIFEQENIIENFYSQVANLPIPPKHFASIPFSVGLIGFISYDYGEQTYIKACSADINKSQVLHDNKTTSNKNTPSIYIGTYTWSLVKELATNIYHLTFSPLCSEQTRNKVRKLIAQAQCSGRAMNKTLPDIQWNKSCSEEDYKQKLERIQSYISQGDCYQVNFTQSFSAKSDINSIDYYMALRQRTKTPYSCYMQIAENFHILSFSPEQFIGIDKRIINTKPIKGTIENSSSSDTASILVNSEKDKAENLMIVDLLRNDLSKVCQLHSVKVDKLFNLETFNNVHHLVSHISGELLPDVTELDAFLSCFPGGSITGAPKKRAMEIIRELEGGPRGAYCGSVFYLNYNGKFDSSILIRTIVQSGNHLTCWGGGGITSGSDLKSEYKESLIKVANLTGILD